MRIRFALALAALLLLVALVPALPASGSGTRTVKVGDDFFSPTRLSVRRRTVVRWRWTGSEPHNVTVTRGPGKFRSRTQTSGSFAHRFTRRGSYTLVCTIHGFSMKIRVR